MKRIISDTETVREGDEFRIPFVMDWFPVYPEMVGKTRAQINEETPGIPCRYLEFRRQKGPEGNPSGPA